jgi:hypothetical protein
MCSLAHNTLRGRGACWSSGMGLGRIDKLIHSHGPAHNPHKVISALNPSFGLATKAKGLQGCGPKGSPGVTSGTPRSVGKCEGVNPPTPKATPALGDGVPVDS